MFDWIASIASAWGGIAAVGVLTTSGVMAVSRDWRINLAALAVQYAFLLLLIATILPPQVALVKLVAGWLACGILLLAGMHKDRKAARDASSPGSIFGFLPFRVVAVAMVAVVAIEASGRPGFALPGLSPSANTASTSLMALALLQLGLTEEPLQAGLGLLTLLSGFELFYAAIEPSVAVIGLLAGVNLAVALAASYISTLALAAPSREAAP